MNIDITLSDAKRAHATCRMPLDMFELFASDNFSRTTSISSDKYYVFQQLSNAIGVFKYLPENIDRDTATLTLSFHDRQLHVKTALKQRKKVADRTRYTIERVRYLNKLIFPLRNKVYDMAFVVRYHPRHNPTLNEYTTTLSHFDMFYRTFPDIIYCGVPLPVDDSLHDGTEDYVRARISAHINRVNRRVAMLRGIAALEQLNTRLFERRVLGIVKEFL